MKAELADSRENRLSLKVSGAELPLLNAIRRYSMSRVPVLAIDKISMYENTSSMFDEYISHRIGLLPIVTPKSTKDGMEVQFSIDEAGPKMVYSGDFKCADKEAAMAKDRIPIITLFEEQNLRLEGTAVVGRGITHAKFQAGLVAYGEDEKGGVTLKAESFFQMEPAEMLVRGCKELENDLAELAKALKKAK
ncbi:DNA-directed RNA polymerase subunit D [Candidatus Micrarchaeota archaeon]|nr:DNA-directed RNA polymerase subunit D [Candidatus Micrarchaeota archaeon]